jgi:hypothetical protein
MSARCSETYFIAVRMNADHHWMDIHTLGGVREVTEQLARQQDAALPQWAHGNPVSRISQVKLTEL